NIAQPRIRLEHLGRQEYADQGRNRFRAIAQAGQRKRDDVKPIEEFRAKTSGGHLVLEGHACRNHQPGGKAWHLLEPSGSKTRSSRTQRSVRCSGRGKPLTLRSTRVPLAASASLPERSVSAPSKAPRTYPNRLAFQQEKAGLLTIHNDKGLLA